MPRDPERFSPLPLLLLPHEHDRLKVAAASREISMNELVRRALRHFFDCKPVQDEKISTETLTRIFD